MGDRWLLRQILEDLDNHLNILTGFVDAGCAGVESSGRAGPRSGHQQSLALPASGLLDSCHAWTQVAASRRSRTGTRYNRFPEDREEKRSWRYKS